MNGVRLSRVILLIAVLPLLIPTVTHADVHVGRAVRPRFEGRSDELFADFSDEAFWDANLIAEANVAKADERLRDQRITLEIVRQFDGGRGLRVKSIADVHFQWVLSEC